MSRAEHLRPDLRHSTLDGVLFAVMVGVGETYLPAFVLAAGHGAIAAGWVATLPMLLGALLQLATPAAVGHLGSHRRWVVLCATVQALAFVPLVGAALAGRAPLTLIFAAAAMYWAGGLGAAPAWSTWIATLAPSAIRARYFAHRTLACHGATLIGLAIGGTALQQVAAGDAPLGAFALLFALAGIARSLSARQLAACSEPVPLPRGYRAVPLLEILRSDALRGARRLIRYMLAVQIAVQVAAPFYSPYMLGRLGLGYGAYTALLAAAFVAKMLALPWLGAVARRIGARRLAWIGGIGIVPVALPWMLTDSLPLLFASQLVAGALWAAYELATFLLMFEHLAERERTSLFAAYNLGNSAAMALGSLLGGALLRAFGAEAHAYAILFLVSTLLRALTLAWLPRERAALRLGRLPELAVTAVRPSLGSLDRPLPAPSELPPSARD